MIDKTTPRALLFYKNRPIIEIYKGYEIRKCYDMFEVIASVGIYSFESNYIEGCREFIDKLVNVGIKQDEDDKIFKYIISLRNKK